MRAVHFFSSLLISLGLIFAAQAAAMFLYHEEVDLSEGGTTQRPVLVTETHQVRFQPPARWHMELTSTNQTVMFYEPGLQAGILMRLWTEGPTNQSNGGSSGWRERIEERLEQAEVTAQFKAHGANAHGLGFDLEQSVTPTTRAAFRIALIPFEGGMAEFELRTSAERATNYHRVFRHLLGSFSAKRLNARPAPGAMDAGPASDDAGNDGGAG